MSRPVKRSFSIKGHQTSISLEAQFWDALKDVAESEGSSISALVGRIDDVRNPDEGLSSAVRLFILDYYRRRSGRADPSL